MAYSLVALLVNNLNLFIIINPLPSLLSTFEGGFENMNVFGIIFYALLCCWLVGLGIWALVKRIKARKQVEQEKEEIENKKDTD